MEFINEMLLSAGMMLPDWAFWLVIIVIGLLVAMFYIFPKQLKQAAEEYDIPYDTVDSLVKMAGSLAVRLWVLRKSVEETEKVARIKNVALTIEMLYPSTSSIRLSQLVAELETAIAQKFQGGELAQHNNVIEDLRDNLVAELVTVGPYIKDNERDPMVNPQEVAVWIEKGIRGVGTAISR